MNEEDINSSKDIKNAKDQQLVSTHPVLLDGICVVVGNNVSDEFKTNSKKFIQETYMHYKPLAVSRSASEFLQQEMKGQPGVTVGDEKGQYVNKFIADISAHRHWDRNINI